MPLRRLRLTSCRKSSKLYTPFVFWLLTKCVLLHYYYGYSIANVLYDHLRAACTLSATPPP